MLRASDGAVSTLSGHGCHCTGAVALLRRCRCCLEQCALVRQAPASRAVRSLPGRPAECGWTRVAGAPGGLGASGTGTSHSVHREMACLVGSVVAIATLRCHRRSGHVLPIPCTRASKRRYDARLGVTRSGVGAPGRIGRKKWTLADGEDGRGNQCWQFRGLGRPAWESR